MSALVDAATLADELERGETLVVDVQYALGGPPSRELYAVAHLPGAPQLSLDAALAGPSGDGGRHPLPDPAVLQEALRECGIDDDSRVVVYDQGTSLSASRAWWTLRWAGLADVRVLDGGLAAWQRASLPVVSAATTPAGAPDADARRGPRGSVTVQPGSLPVVEVEDVPRAAREGILLDVRAPERYRGEVEPIDPVAGHIPGAINVPVSGLFASATDPHPGALPPEETLRERLAPLIDAVGAGRPVGVYCGSGVSAAQAVLALATLGIEAPLYAGSWSAWSHDPSRPVATGPA